MKALVFSIATLCVACASFGASAQPTMELETWQPASPRVGPWADDVSQLTRAFEEEKWTTLAALLARLKPLLLSRYGEASPGYAEALMLEGLMLYETDRREESLPFILQSATQYEAALGAMHRDVAIALHTYADALIEARGDGALHEAESFYRRAYRIRNQLFGASTETIAAGSALASTLMRRAEHDNDPALLEEAETIALSGVTTAAPAMDFDYTNAWETYCAILFARGDLLVAEAALRRALSDLSMALEQHRPWAEARLYPLLIEALERQGKTAEAAIARGQFEGWQNPT